MPIQTRNPATGQIVKTFEALTEAEIDDAITRNLAAKDVLGKMSYAQRAQALIRLADLLETKASELGAIMTLEMGKTHKSAIAEAEKCAAACRYYAAHGAEHLADEPVKTDARQAYRKYLPLGPILAIMPWNYPFWQVVRFAAPALMAGNTVLLKHASNVPQCALALEELIGQAGFPKDAFITLLISASQTEQVLRDERVRAATLTGSEPAGSAVAKICADVIKPTVLELGGSDPILIMPSADIDKAVLESSQARIKNNGQSCIAAKRFIIHADIYDEVRDKVVKMFKAYQIGDPMDDKTDIGPLVDANARDCLLDQVRRAVKDGARLLTGGTAIEGAGYYVLPGVLEDIPASSDLFYEEFFGPVALLFKVDSLDAAIDLANDSHFGLGSAIWTRESDEQERAIAQIEAGATFVNSITSSDPRLPFGGIKRSGYGRELAAEGIRAFCNIKTVSIA